MQLTLTVPDAANISETDAQLLFAMKLFESGKLPLGKAAEVAGEHALALPEWILIKEVGDKNTIISLNEFIDLGESQALLPLPSSLKILF